MKFFLNFGRFSIVNLTQKSLNVFSTHLCLLVACELVIFVSALLQYSSSTVKSLYIQYRCDCVKHIFKVIQTFLDHWAAVKNSFGLYMKYYQNCLHVGLIFLANFFIHHFLECINLSNRPSYLCVFLKLNLHCI